MATTKQSSEAQNLLSFGFIIAIALVVAVIAIGLSRMKDVTHTIERVVNEHNVQANLLRMMRNTSRERSLILQSMVMTQDPFERDEMFIAYRDRGEEFLKTRSVLYALDHNPDERQLLDDIQSKIAAIVTLQERVIELLSDDHFDQAGDILIHQAIPTQNTALDLMDGFISLQQVHGREALALARKDFGLAYQLMIALGIIAAVLSGVTVNYVMRRIGDIMSDLNTTGQQLRLSNDHLKDEIDERFRIENDLQKSESRERAIRESMMECVITINRHGIVESCNPAAERLFGYRKNELVGRNVSTLMPEPDRSQHNDYLKRYIEGGKPKIIGSGRELMAQHKDGHTFPVELGVTELRDDEEQLFIGILRDVSERKQAEQELQTAKDELERRVKQRTSELEEANRRLNAQLNQQ